MSEVYRIGTRRCGTRLNKKPMRDTRFGLYSVLKDKNVYASHIGSLSAIQEHTGL